MSRYCGGNRFTVATRKRRVAHIKALIRNFKAKGCLHCGCTDLSVLTCHHQNPERRSFYLGDWRNAKARPIDVVNELRKCICLCEHCHRRIHEEEAHNG